MSEFLSQYGLFLAKVVTVTLAVLLILGRVLVAMHQRRGGEDRLQVRRLNRRLKQFTLQLQRELLPGAAFKRLAKAEKAERKAEQQEGAPQRRRVYVLDFQGDLRASAVASLREEVTAVLTVAAPGDEVLLRLESPGGTVHGYGLAAAQLERLRDRGLRLTVAIDKVAASGGYMMACVAQRILSAPFAVVGSIGVVAQMPNFHRVLQKHDIDFELITAGEHKRTLTLFGENTDKGRQQVRLEVEDAHALFKEFIGKHRPVVDMDRVATGAHWYGLRALELKLVDEIRTSDDYLLEAGKDAELLELRFVPKKPLGERLSNWMSLAVERGLQRVLDRAQDGPFG